MGYFLLLIGVLSHKNRKQLYFESKAIGTPAELFTWYMEVTPARLFTR